MDDFELLTLREAAKALRIKDVARLRGLAQAGDIGYVRDGRLYKFRREDIAAYIAANHHPAVDLRSSSARRSA